MEKTLHTWRDFHKSSVVGHDHHAALDLGAFDQVLGEGVPWVRRELLHAQGDALLLVVELEEGIDGLVHISQIAKERVEKVTDYLSEGQEVRVIVLDVERGRIKLSMKEVPEEEEQVDEASGAEETAQHSDDTSATNEAEEAQATEGADAAADEAADPADNDGSEEQPS